MLKQLRNIMPPWSKYLAILGIFLASYLYGYVCGIVSESKEEAHERIRIVKIQGKVTEKVITKYVKEKQAQDKVDDKIISEGNNYVFEKSSNCDANDTEFVRLFNNSVTGVISPLSSGDDGKPKAP